MEKLEGKSVIIVFNHFQISDGISRSVIGLANFLADKKNMKVTLKPLFKYDKQLTKQLSSQIIIKPVFKTYFKGFNKILDLLPKSFLRKLVISKNYDVEIAYSMTLPIKIVASRPSNLWIKEQQINSVRIAWMHGYDEGLLLKKEYLEIGKVVCVSQHNALRLKDELPNIRKVDFAYNLLDENQIIKLANDFIPNINKLNSDKVNFVSVGRLSPEKGYYRLIKIFKKLKDQGYEFTLQIIGNGPEIGRLENLIKETNLSDAVFLRGAKSNPHCYTKNCDIFLCSSYSEGFSTACTEAVMLGIPVISTEVSGAKEIINLADAGMLAKGVLSQDLYQAIKFTLDNKEIIERWKNRLQTTSKNFYKCHREEILSQVLDTFCQSE